MNAIILSIGDELVLGQTIDTNSAWISEHLAAVGCEILAHITVPDDQNAIEQAIKFAAWRAETVIISGGIGPTEDDLTRQALADVMGVELELNERWLHRLKAFFRARGRVMPQTNQIQAMIPHGADIIENTCGTAAGIDAEYDAHAEMRQYLLSAHSREKPAISDSSDVREEYKQRLFGEESWFEKLLRERKLRVVPTRIFAIPGVPKEMKAMFTRDVLPHIQQSTGGAVILSRTLHTFGLGESFVAERLGELMKRDRNPSVGTTVANGIVSLRINARFEARDLAHQKLDETIRACGEALGDLIFGEEDQSLSQIVAASLASSGMTVTTAESCTGGLLAKMLTDIPGSSDYFKTGYITYSDESKQTLLGVPIKAINEHGAVSEPVVRAMAVGALERSDADFALSVSGIAGPTGGTPSKPVGTVCIALAVAHWVHNQDSSTHCTARTFTFAGDREMIRDRSAKMALTMLRFHLLGKPLPF